MQEAKVQNQSNQSNSVPRLGEISPFGRKFFALGAFFSEKYRPNDLAAIFFTKIAQNSP
jgi:hypothetical protein